MKRTSKGNKALFFLAILTLSLFMAMYCDPIGYRYNQGELPETPVNLQEFNTQYDDYNSTAPSLGDLVPFCFSSNRKSQGEHFDVLYEEGKTTGKVMSISCHPFIIGVPSRIRCLDKILEHITQHKDVWLATGSEIVAWYDKHYLKVSQ